MIKSGSYHVGRVIKLGKLDHERLIGVICDSPIFNKRGFNWTFTNVVDESDKKFPFVFGRLSKFSDQGHLSTVDRERRIELDRVAPNMLVASSPFVYLPEYSGIAYLNVWDGLEHSLFEKRFRDLVVQALEDFFVDCIIEPLADYQAFTSKLKELDCVKSISARVHPPNPLYGRFWKKLNDYVRSRNADSVKIEETANATSVLNTKIVEHVEGIQDLENYEPQEPVDIGDAAILMAADGYGNGKVTGHKNSESVVIKTSDTQKTFRAPTDPNPKRLALLLRNILERVNRDRGLEH